MVKKRKSPAAATATASTTTTAPSATPPKKQQKKQDDEQSTKIAEEQPPVVEIPIEEDHEEEIEEVEEEVDEEEEQVDEDDGGEEDEDIDSISSLMEPFTKEQLITLLSEAAKNHPDVASRVRNLADKDVVHRKIFVHGLGWDTTAETLIAAFQQYGEIEDCKAVTDKLTGKSKGYGFILFKTRGGARKALREPQKVISGRTASCQLAAVGPTAGGSGQVAVTPATEYTQKKIYVSNVSPDIDPNKLTTYFRKFGEIEEGPLGIDRSTGKFKGFCLYVYKSVESARKALEEPHKQFEGHTLHCQQAIDGPKHVKGGGGGGGGHARASGGGYVRGENPNLIGAVGGPPATGAGLMGGVAGAGGLNPALGQALTALLATQGTGLGLNNLLGGIGGGVGGLGGMGGYAGQSSGYGGSVGIGGGPGVGGLSGYGSQGGLQSGYPNQQLGQGGFGRSQFGYNGRPYGGR